MIKASFQSGQFKQYFAAPNEESGENWNLPVLRFDVRKNERFAVGDKVIPLDAESTPVVGEVLAHVGEDRVVVEWPMMASQEDVDDLISSKEFAFAMNQSAVRASLEPVPVKTLLAHLSDLPKADRIALFDNLRRNFSQGMQNAREGWGNVGQGLNQAYQGVGQGLSGLGQAGRGAIRGLGQDALSGAGAVTRGIGRGVTAPFRAIGRNFEEGRQQYQQQQPQVQPPPVVGQTQPYPLPQSLPQYSAPVAPAPQPEVYNVQPEPQSTQEFAQSVSNSNPLGLDTEHQTYVKNAGNVMRRLLSEASPQQKFEIQRYFAEILGLAV